MANGNSGTTGTTSTGSPCGACKFLRRKCAEDCIFAPYFRSEEEEGTTRFAAIHKVFGASNASKLLLHVPVPHRPEAVVSISYEAQARLRDPVFDCVSHIFALQQQVAYLQAQLMQVKAQIAQNMIDSRNVNENQWATNHMINGPPNIQPYYMNPISPQTSIESMELNKDIGMMSDFQEIQSRSSEEQLVPFQSLFMKRSSFNGDLGELQALAYRMMMN